MSIFLSRNLLLLNSDALVTSSFLLLVMPRATSSVLLLVAMPLLLPSSVLFSLQIQSSMQRSLGDPLGLVWVKLVFVFGPGTPSEKPKPLRSLVSSQIFGWVEHGDFHPKTH